MNQIRWTLNSMVHGCLVINLCGENKYLSLSCLINQQPKSILAINFFNSRLCIVLLSFLRSVLCHKIITRSTYKLFLLLSFTIHIFPEKINILQDKHCQEGHINRVLLCVLMISGIFFHQDFFKMFSQLILISKNCSLIHS